MRKIIFILLLSLFFEPSFSQRNIDVLHYEFNISLNDANDTLYGKAGITVKFLQPASSDLVFHLTLLNKNGKGMIIDHVKTEEGSETDVKQMGDSIRLVFKKPFHANDTARFFVYYHGIPDDGLIISGNKHGDRTFFGDNWPNRAHHWIPCVDDPADKASFEFLVTAPDHYQVISNGVQTQEMEFPGNRKLTRWEEDIPLSTKIMVIGVAKFAVREFPDSPAGIPVSAWVYPQDSVKGFRNYSVAPGILKFLTGYIGPYPYQKLANVQSTTIFGGMENASAIFYDESSASSPRSVESLLAHEITHQWFGDMASEKSFPHLWLSEGFATYLTHIYIESKYGTDSLHLEMQKDRNEVIAFTKTSDRPVVDSLSPLMELLNVNSYQKGGWVLHMLRRQLGDSVFHTIIRNYYAAYAGKNADSKDFQKICENASGKNLETFFQQWLYTPGLPILKVTWSYSAITKNILVRVEQLQKQLFRFPLDVQVQTAAGKPQLQTLSISAQNQQFSIPVKGKPTGVYLDPGTSLLFEGIISSIN